MLLRCIALARSRAGVAQALGNLRKGLAPAAASAALTQALQDEEGAQAD
jgi:hypothetical protein